jgi:hypothetical protein
VGDWYYIGHYGQLGPLTRDQINELIEADVISHETYVWKVGMSEWAPAGRVVELAAYFTTRAPSMSPPPPPPGPLTQQQAKHEYNRPQVYASYPPSFVTIKSDKSRALAGILQLIIPGVGRMYLGYAAYGVLQLVFALCGVGAIWSFIDGIFILAGGVRYDGYGRRLGE